MKFGIVIFFCVLSIICNAQFKFDKKNNIPVKFDNNILSKAWDGGLNYTQFSEIDFDFDGDMDLFIFDRTRDNIRLYENKLENVTRKYIKVENPNQFFPQDLRYRVAILDYNNDGKNDIFTYGVGGVRVYKNTGNQQLGLQWELASNALYSDYNGNYSNLFVSLVDIPAYVDVDFDGDVDILTFDISGERIEYHKNLSKELYNHSDSLVFVLKNECWGRFKEDPSSFNVFLNSDSYPCVDSPIDNPESPKMPTDKKDSLNRPQLRHAGSTILALDYNNDGVMDIVLGDVSSSHLNLLINGGTSPNTNSPMISQDQNFPSNTVPAELDIFPAAFYLDVDFDGIKDLIVGANAKNSSQNANSILFFKNFGSNNLPNFQFQTNSFLQEDMIDVGSGAIPIFFDQNMDGLEDLFVANFFRYKIPFQKETNLTFYRNFGLETAPEFNFIESDYLNFTSQSYGLRAVPTFGDIDNDGDKDMFVGLENGTLSLYKNNALPGANANFANPIHNYKDVQSNPISAVSYAYPQLFDLNNDGLLDLLIGNKNGEIVYYQNVGTLTEPSFELKNSKLGEVDIAPFGSNGYAAPHFFSHQDTTYLLLGGQEGKLLFYKGIDGNLEVGNEFELISDFFRNINVESYSTCWVNDIDNDGNLDLFVGGELGGIAHYENNDNSILEVFNLNENLNLPTVFPNPFSDEIFVQLNEDFEFEIRDFSGKKCTKGNSNGKIDTIDLSKGFYILHIVSKTQKFQTKIIKK